MNIKFTNPEMIELQEAFNELLPDSLTMNQYELAEATLLPAESWSAFLRDGQVSKAIDAELQLVIKSNQAKLVSNAADNDRSVGAAQMLNAMAKIDSGDKAESNFFIYSYVPPTSNETQAPFVREETEWVPPVQIIEHDEETDELLKQVAESKVTEVKEVTEEKAEVDEDDWF